LLGTNCTASNKPKNTREKQLETWHDKNENLDKWCNESSAFEYEQMILFWIIIFKEISLRDKND
jgi:hypothetical protein